MSSVPQLFLNTTKAKHFDGRHPWVLNRSVVDPTAPLEPGAVVELLQPNGSWIGRGIYNPHSRIRIRLYQWEREQTLDAAWIREQLDWAVQLREKWMQANQALEAVRLVNSEGDGLSGLVVDRFGSYLIVQVTSLAVQRWLPEITDWLTQRFSPDGIQVQIDSQVAKLEGIDGLDAWIHGNAPQGSIHLQEHGVKLQVDLSAGQKTGYFLDQRANRLEAAKWIHSGSMLDVCCYQGGFSLAACQVGSPDDVLAIDSSETALQFARANAKANGFSQIEFQRADCFDFLEERVKENRKFQTVVLDPPRMASNREQVSSALRAYHRLNLAAVRLLETGGLLVTCSCSGRVSRSEFWGVLSSAAKRNRRRIQVLVSRGADFDHPIDVNCPESDYLKCFICRVL